MTTPTDPARELTEKIMDLSGVDPCEAYTKHQIIDLIRSAFADALEDTERLRWVLAHPLKFAVVMGGMWSGDSTAVSLEAGRAAIDAARQGEGEEGNE